LMLEDYDLEEAIRDDLQRILDDAQRCRDTVKELLEFTRQTRHLMQPYDLNEAISRTLFLFEDQSLFHNIAIEKQLGDNLPPIQADIQQLNHLFMNIIHNAAQAMEGKGKLTVNTFQLSDKKDICIEISDSGPGIPPDILPHIFEPFFTTKEEGEGTGLGLSLAYGIVENHKGQITARNKPDGGAVFTITFPVTDQGNDGDQRAEK
jgi:two-component system NtrC family sensor kinase